MSKLCRSQYILKHRSSTKMTITDACTRKSPFAPVSPGPTRWLWQRTVLSHVLGCPDLETVGERVANCSIHIHLRIPTTCEPWFLDVVPQTKVEYSQIRSLYLAESSCNEDSRSIVEQLYIWLSVKLEHK